jgi:hypothetical protein
VHSNPEKFSASKPGQLSWGFRGRKLEKKSWGFSVRGRMEEDGSVAVWVEAAGHGRAASALDANTLRADGDALIGTDLGL